MCAVIIPTVIPEEPIFISAILLFNGIFGLTVSVPKGIEILGRYLTYCATIKTHDSYTLRFDGGELVIYGDNLFYYVFPYSIALLLCGAVLSFIAIRNLKKC